MKSLRRLACAAALALAAGAAFAAAPDADETLRNVLRATSRDPGLGERALKDIAEMRPQIAYQVALELCEAGLGRRASGADAGEDFSAARRIVAAMRPTEQRKALAALVEAYAGLDRKDASHWQRGQSALARAEALLQASRLDEAFASLQEAQREAEAIGDPLLGARISSTLGVVAKDKGFLDVAERALRAAIGSFELLREFRGAGRAWGNLGLAQRQRGQYDDALASSERSRYWARLAGDPETLAGEWSNAGLVHNRLGRYREALEDYTRALEAFPESTDPRTRATVLQNLALVRENLGNVGEAARGFEAALALVEDTSANAYARAILRSNLGRAQAKQGNLALAATYMEGARNDFRRLGRPAELAVSELNLAGIELQRGRAAESLAGYERALRLARTNAFSQAEAQSLLGMADIALLQGRAADALEWSRQACALPGAAGALRAQCERSQGRAHVALGALDAARSRYDRALAALEEIHAGLGDPTEVGAEAIAVEARPVYREAIDVLLALDAAQPGRGHGRAAFLVSERAKSRVFQDQVRRTGVRWGASAQDPAFRSLLAEERRALAQAVEFGRQARSGTSPDAGTREAQARASLDAVRRRLREAYPAYREVERPRTVSLEDIQASLSAGEAILAYAVGERRSAAFVIRKTTFAALALDIGEVDLARRIDALRRGLEPPAGEQDAGRFAAALRGFDPAAAVDLYRSVFDKAAAQLAGAERIYVSADGVLFLLPFGALVDPSFDAARFRAARERADGTRAPLLAEYADVPFAAGRHRIRYLPAASVLVYLRQRAPVAGGKWEAPLVAFADPVFDGEQGGTQRGKLARLKASDEEARKVAAIVKARGEDIYLRERASESNVYAARLSRARYVLFSTHGVIGGDYAGASEPALVLTQVGNPEGEDGLLTMSEVLGLELSAEVTVLSACSTAGVPSRSGGYGEGFSGLARSFMYAGSRSVLVTHWSVFETVARDFVVEFFKRAPDASLDVALAGAVAATRRAEAVMDSRAKISLAHPTFWAGFALLGD